MKYIFKSLSWRELALAVCLHWASMVVCYYSNYTYQCWYGLNRGYFCCEHNAKRTVTQFRQIWVWQWLHSYNDENGKSNFYHLPVHKISVCKHYVSSNRSWWLPAYIFSDSWLVHCQWWCFSTCWNLTNDNWHMFYRNSAWINFLWLDTINCKCMS